MSRVTTRFNKRHASFPLIMYFINGETSINAAELRIAQYLRSSVSSYDPATRYPAHRRQFWGRQSFEVRSWKGVCRSWSICSSRQPVFLLTDNDHFISGKSHTITSPSLSGILSAYNFHFIPQRALR